MQRQTTMMKKGDITRNWYVVDAEGLTLGRMATQIAAVITGKNKPTFTPNLDCGDYVIVINAEKVAMNGKNKLDNKKYYNVSQYLGGLRTRTARTMVKDYPVELIERVVWGMIPKGPLGRAQIKKLFVYAGAEHPHAAQNPQALEIK
jgi:large subunit ribosomal protein L13